MAKCIRGYSIIFTNTAFVFEKKNKSSSFLGWQDINIPYAQIIFSISFQENLDGSSFGTEEMHPQKGRVCSAVDTVFISVLFEKKCFCLK